MNKSTNQIKQNEKPLKTGETRIRFSHYRTSADIISEAKRFLNKMTSNGPNQNKLPTDVGITQVLNTKRPITPRDAGRTLYGKVSLAGRPPSVFSMQHLEQQCNVTTTKTDNEEPIESSVMTELSNHRIVESSNSELIRSQSLELANVGIHRSTKGIQSTLPRRLPAMKVQGFSLNLAEHNKGRKIPRSITTSSFNDTPKSIYKSTNRFPSFLININDPFSKSSTEALIEILKNHKSLKSYSNETIEKINMILIEIYNRVFDNEKLFNKAFILDGLYGLVECNSPKILLGIARIILSLQVSGSNLTGACKLVFKVARNEHNDHLFHNNDVLELLIDGLGRASPLEDPEVCIYGYGTIRFLTCCNDEERSELMAALNSNRNIHKKNNKNDIDNFILPPKPSTAPSLGIIKNNLMWHRSNREKLCEQDALVVRLAKHGAVQLMILHLQMLNETGSIRKLYGMPLHSLYQLSAALRALADIRQYSASMENFPNNNIQLELACPHLVKTAEITIDEIEIQANIIRTLSILSEDKDCCKVLSKFTQRLGVLLGPCCNIHNNRNNIEKSLSIISRLGYILGNIMAKYNYARLEFYDNDVAMEYLHQVLDIYHRQRLTMQNSMGDTVIDVLIKMIRVVANMSVNNEVGLALGKNMNIINVLLKLLNTTEQPQTIQMKDDFEELLHVILGTLHNLCFYQEETIEMETNQLKTVTKTLLFSEEINKSLSKLAVSLCSLLEIYQDDIENITLLEIIRVLGNLTRNSIACKYFCNANGLPIILNILNKIFPNINNHHHYDHDDFKACLVGILINILVNVENRIIFKQYQGVLILLRSLKQTLQFDEQIPNWFLASVICQAFWNLFSETKNLKNIYSLNVLEELCDLLADHIDENKILKYANKKLSGQNIQIFLQMWENFAIVATDLLERLQHDYEIYNKTNGKQFVINDDNDDNDRDNVSHCEVII